MEVRSKSERFESSVLSILGWEKGDLSIGLFDENRLKTYIYGDHQRALVRTETVKVLASLVEVAQRTCGHGVAAIHSIALLLTIPWLIVCGNRKF